MVELLKKEDYRFNSREPSFSVLHQSSVVYFVPVGRSTVNIFFNPLSSCAIASDCHFSILQLQVNCMQSTCRFSGRKVTK